MSEMLKNEAMQVLSDEAKQAVTKAAKQEAFLNKLFTYAEAKGVSHLEVCLEEKSSLSLTVNQGSLDGFTVSEELVAAIRGLHNEKLGMTYSEQISEDQAEGIISALIESAALGNEAKWCDHETKKPKETADFSQHFNVVEVSIQEKIDFALALEKHAKESDPKVTKTDYCQYEEFQLRRHLRRADGLSLSETQQGSMAVVSAVAEFSGEVRTATAHETGSDLKFLSAEKMGKEAGKLAANSIGAKSVKSGKYPVILKNTVAAGLLEGFIPVFYGDKVLYQMSRLGEQIGRKIANSKVTIVDDPHMRGGGRTTFFDDEGTLTQSNVLVENGVLKTFLHNGKTAEAFGTKSTGNGFRMQHKSSVEVFATNLRIENGSERLNDLQVQMNNGIMITDIQGAFAGINPISGDFSLQASGFWVHGGVVTDAISGITISGNFYEMLQEVESIANDLKFGLPYGTHVGSPSLLLKELSVAGE